MNSDKLPELPKPAIWRARGQIWSEEEIFRRGWMDEAEGLFTVEQMLAVANSEQGEVVECHSGTSDRREWVNYGTWLYPGDKLILVSTNS